MEKLPQFLSTGFRVLLVIMLAPAALGLLAFAADMMFRHLPSRLADQLRPTAIAEIRRVDETCILREPIAADDLSRRRNRRVRVSCEGLQDELAQRPAGTTLVRRQTRVALAFQTATGQLVETEVSSRALRLPAAPVVGQRVTIMYDAKAPARTVRVARDAQSFTASLAALLIPLLLIFALAWRLQKALRNAAQAYRARTDRLPRQPAATASRRADAPASGAWKQEAYRPRPATAATATATATSKAKPQKKPPAPRRPVVERAGWF